MNKIMFVSFMLSMFLCLIAMGVEIVKPYDYGGKLFQAFEKVAYWIIGIMFFVPILYAMGWCIWVIINTEFS